MSEPLPDDFAAALAASADRRGPFGQPVVFQSSTRSTNDVAQALAEAGAPQGAVALAFAQTAGRGRQGREWFSPPGAGIYMSVVIRSPAVAPMLTLAGGVAVAEGIRRATGLPVFIKWPNDVVVEDEHAPGRRRKLAGLLAEGSTGHNGLQHVVLGIGINVRPADYPAELAARVTSLEHELGRAVDPGLVLCEILVALNEQMNALEGGLGHQVLSRWRALAPSATARSRSAPTAGSA
jgi:BirA family biotin operon repressor/biotin-[acetyl-CoA-carboxylase] ligase